MGRKKYRQYKKSYGGGWSEPTLEHKMGNPYREVWIEDLPKKKKKRPDRTSSTSKKYFSA